jgi:hypothetical protein
MWSAVILSLAICESDWRFAMDWLGAGWLTVEKITNPQLTNALPRPLLFP